MADPKKNEQLPGNHGQFGVNNASEEHKTLQDVPAPPAPKPGDAAAPAKTAP